MLASLKQSAGTDAFFARSIARWEAMPAEPPLPMKMTRPPCSRARNQAVRVAEILAKTPSSIAVARWRRPT
ncbi:hypothetical protein ACVWWO_001365 [Bradyrhizobium sp. F1.13.1]|jgi:hypothetical protein